MAQASWIVLLKGYAKDIPNFKSGLLIIFRKKTLKNVYLPEPSQNTAKSWLTPYASGTGACRMYSTKQIKTLSPFPDSALSWVKRAPGRHCGMKSHLICKRPQGQRLNLHRSDPFRPRAFLVLTLRSLFLRSWVGGTVATPPLGLQREP